MEKKKIIFEVLLNNDVDKKQWCHVSCAYFTPGL